MWFRSPTDDPVHIGLTNGRATLITKDGADIDDEFYAKAYQLKCVPLPQAPAALLETSQEDITSNLLVQPALEKTPKK